MTLTEEPTAEEIAAAHPYTPIMKSVPSEEVIEIARRVIAAMGISASSISILRRKLFRPSIRERAAMESMEQLRFEAAMKSSFRMQIAIAAASGSPSLFEKEMLEYEIGCLRVRIIAMAQDEMERIGIPRNWGSAHASLALMP